MQFVLLCKLNKNNKRSTVIEDESALMVYFLLVYGTGIPGQFKESHLLLWPPNQQKISPIYEYFLFQTTVCTTVQHVSQGAIPGPAYPRQRTGG